MLHLRLAARAPTAYRRSDTPRSLIAHRFTPPGGSLNSKDYYDSGGVPAKHFQQGSKGCGAPLPKRDPPASAAVTDKLLSSCAVLQRKEPDNRFPADYDGAFAPESARLQQRTAEATRPIP